MCIKFNGANKRQFYEIKILITKKNKAPNMTHYVNEIMKTKT